MAGCNSIRANLTALADGELSRWQNWRVASHLSGCIECRREADLTRQEVQSHAVLLQRALAGPPTDVDGLRRKLRIAIASLPDDPRRFSLPAIQWLRPLVASGAAVMLLFSAVSWSYGGPKTFLIALDLIEPPSALASKTEMFNDYPIIQNLEALENFDGVNSVPLEDEQSSANQPVWVG